jgi:hypothetical protein
MSAGILSERYHNYTGKKALRGGGAPFFARNDASVSLSVPFKNKQQ